MFEKTHISRTRRGFLYQDKYALLEILKYLEKGSLREAYVDENYPPGNKSLDIKLILEGAEELVYEVKTGDHFKGNVGGKKFKEVVLGLFDYCEDKQKNKVFLIINPLARGAILQLWVDLISIREIENPVLMRGKKKRIDALIKKYWDELGFKSIGVKIKKFQDFICKINLEVGPDDEPDEHANFISDLDNKIEYEIRKFAIKFSIKDSGSVQVPYSSISNELLSIIQLTSAGGVADLKKAIGKRLANCLARRSVLAGQNIEGNMEKKVNEKTEEMQELILGERTEKTLSANQSDVTVIN